jgi:hypothetical protein
VPQRRASVLSSLVTNINNLSVGRTLSELGSRLHLDFSVVRVKVKGVKRGQGSRGSDRSGQAGSSQGQAQIT